MNSQYDPHLIIPESSCQRIENWILLVSNYQPSSMDSIGTSDDEDIVVVTKSAPSTKKRPRADSSPIAERSRIVITRRGTPFQPLSPTPLRDPTPAASTAKSQSDGDNLSMADGVSEADSSVTAIVRRRDKTKVARLNADREEELAKCIARIKSSKSDAYKGFEDPIIDYTKDPPTHYRFKCKHCPVSVPRHIGVSETSGLFGHFNRCPGCVKQPTLVDDFGVTGSSSKLTREDVREFCALWICENARPLQIVTDRYLRKILHPDARKYLPHRDTISQDIKRMYNASQTAIRSELEGIVGVFHIALDMLSSSNGLDFLGLVLFHQCVTEGNTLTLKRFVLECLSFGGEQHTGVALARTVHAILGKFKIQDRALSTVFRKKKPDGACSDTDDADDDDKHNLCIDFEQEECDPEDVDGDDLEHAPSWNLNDDDSNELLSEVELPEMDDMDEMEAARVGSILWKLAKFVHKIRYSARARMAFKAACDEHEVERPHNVRRDVQTRWNSTCDMAVDAERTFPAIISTQRDTSLGIPRQHRLHSEDRKYVRALISLFKPLSVVTEILSRAGVPLLADVILHFDSLEYEYTNIAAGNTQPAYMRLAAHRACAVLNKYYDHTDQSDLYHAAILLHPSMRRQYLVLAEWPTGWIEKSVNIVMKIYQEHYKPPSSAPALTRTTGTSQFGYSSYMSRMYSNLADQSQSTTCPVQEFINAPPTIDYGDKNEPIFRNPIQWWYNQRLGGNEWDGLTQMALDVLSTPATSVDVERAFSYVGSIVSKRRHNLKPYSIQAMSTLGSYSKALGWTPSLTCYSNPSSTPTLAIAASVHRFQRTSPISTTYTSSLTPPLAYYTKLQLHSDHFDAVTGKGTWCGWQIPPRQENQRWFFCVNIISGGEVAIKLELVKLDPSRAYYTESQLDSDCLDATISKSSPCGWQNRLGKKIGSGSFGDIYLSVNIISGGEVAIKLESVKLDPSLTYYTESRLGSDRNSRFRGTSGSPVSTTYTPGSTPSLTHYIKSQLDSNTCFELAHFNDLHAQLHLFPCVLRASASP
ncbi:alpha-glucosidase C [Ceratobasidium sp. AG-Ba]|nr:alpha-glucosidase C [Ceratobasidium sp. AG-Ba]